MATSAPQQGPTAICDSAGANNLVINTDGSINVGGGSRSTYSVGKTGLVPASSATDIFIIGGAANSVVRINRIEITATSTAATSAALDVQLIKRSTAAGGGTSTAPTAVPHDSNNAASVAVLAAYTANPTTGTSVGTLRSQKLIQTLATQTATDFPLIDHLSWEFGSKGQPITLRAAAEQLAINLNAATATATASFDISVEWTESAS